MRQKISSWVRQSRYRAKRYRVHSLIDVKDIYILFNDFDGKCAYCTMPATTMDHPFPLSNRAPNVPANVLPCCHGCKTKKGTMDLVKYLADGNIANDKFMELVRSMLTRGGANELSNHIKAVTGIGL